MGCVTSNNNATLCQMRQKLSELRNLAIVMERKCLLLVGQPQYKKAIISYNKIINEIISLETKIRNMPPPSPLSPSLYNKQKLIY
jgi:hypothetical protein